jgi:hypothetical protein
MWVNRVSLTVRPSLPAFPDKQTFSGSVGMSQRCLIGDVTPVYSITLSTVASNLEGSFRPECLGGPVSKV